MHTYEIRPRKDKRGVNLISEVLPFGRLWYAGPNAVSNAIGYAKHYSRSHDAVIRAFASIPAEFPVAQPLIVCIVRAERRGEKANS
jgi:hypothetical protein